MTEREVELEIRCGDAKMNMETTIALATMSDKNDKIMQAIVKINKSWLETYAPDSHSIKEAERFLNGA